VVDFGCLRPLHTNAVILPVVGNCIICRAFIISSPTFVEGRMFQLSTEAKFNFGDGQAIIVAGQYPAWVHLSQRMMRKKKKKNWNAIGLSYCGWSGIRLWLNLIRYRCFKRRQSDLYVREWFYLQTFVT